MPSAARYFPFRIAPNATRVVRNPPGTDDEGQRRAVRFDAVHTATMAAARALWWPPPIVLALGIGTGYWIVSLVVTASCAVAITILYRIAGHARDEVRLLDSAVGIPVPDDTVDAVVATGAAMDSLKEMYDQGVDDSEMAELLRPHVSLIRDYDQLYLTGLHDARRHWVGGDVEGWREAARHLPVVANGVAQLLDTIARP